MFILLLSVLYSISNFRSESFMVLLIEISNINMNNSNYAKEYRNVYVSFIIFKFFIAKLMPFEKLLNMENN